jgi:N-methylhydantoinase B/oxoprolinase/acetone carboxylase alpha subunit
MSRHHFEDVVSGSVRNAPPGRQGGRDGGQGAANVCDANGDSARVRIWQQAAARNDRTRCHHSGCSGFFASYAGCQNN